VRRRTRYSGPGMAAPRLGRGGDSGPELLAYSLVFSRRSLGGRQAPESAAFFVVSSLGTLILLDSKRHCEREADPYMASA
jgi:hypothetical protein